jgi:F0F1-type ATP synthase assembly protein I
VKSDSKGPDNYQDSPWYALARYMGIGLEVATAIVVSLYVGYKLDQRFGFSPLFLVISLVVGFAVVINILLYYSRAAERDADRKNRK